MLNMMASFFLTVFGIIRRRDKALFILIVLFLFLLASNNLSSPDRDAYRIYYKTIRDISFNRSVEVGFQSIICVSNFFGLSFQDFLYLYYAICFLLIYRIINRISKNPVLPTIMYMFFPFILDVDQMRSLLGYLIVLNALITFLYTDYTSKHQLKFCFMCLIASLFQQSCIIYCVLALCKSEYRKIRKHAIYVSIAIIFGRPIITAVSSRVGFLNLSRVGSYFDNIEGKNNWYIYVIFYLLIIYFTITMTKKYSKDSFNPISKYIENINILSIVFVALIIVNPHFERLIRPVLLMDYICLTNLIDEKITKYYQLHIICFLLLFCIGRFYFYYSGNGMKSYIEPIFYDGYNFINVISNFFSQFGLL